MRAGSRVTKCKGAHQLDLNSPVWIVANAAAGHKSVWPCDPVLSAEFSIPCCGIWDRIPWIGYKHFRVSLRQEHIENRAKR